MELAAKYNAAEVEDKWYAYWLDHKFFHSEPNEKELISFSVINYVVSRAFACDRPTLFFDM